ncbi:peptide chain release factor N(5)-glutamine methyltransferase [Roseovarius aestuariivivens]|uniref:peptide chain release factor N(5)-glutamine methyltransferase n=1 Tax=Roseovarius aestuariivivens TaxID=1888910 RepID=UPI0010817C68|nr:peptide chain release factor N(5)-glutamine methyltransferase [Roseovarius aestuariivivens]
MSASTRAEPPGSALARVLAQGACTDAGDRRRLLAAAAGVAPGRLSLLDADALTDAVVARYVEYARRRAKGEPVSHILGYRAFWAHEFEVTPDVLDPRADTETLVAAALETSFDHVLDLGTGSGCILLSLLAERPTASGTGTDISGKALDVAARNAVRLGVSDRAMFLCGSWFENVEGTFDLIVSNPPYIAVQELPELSAELTFEPRGALTDEADGLSAYRAIVPRAGAYLRPGGRLMVEIGWRQAAEVAAMFDAAGFAAVEIRHDLEGRDRVVLGLWTG